MKFDPDQSDDLIEPLFWILISASERRPARMDDGQNWTVSALQERADHYRQLARGAVSWSVADQLDNLADECDSEASRLSAKGRNHRSRRSVSG